MSKTEYDICVIGGGAGGRVDGYLDDLSHRPGVEAGSLADHDYGSDDDKIRPGALTAWILRAEERGERIKR